MNATSHPLTHHTLRTHSHTEALGEVWAALAPAVSAVGSRPAEAYEALGYLQLFAPTHNICAWVQGEGREAGREGGGEGGGGGGRGDGTRNFLVI